MADILQSWDARAGVWFGEEMRAWSGEVNAHFQRLSAHNIQALHDLAACRNGLEVVKVEQDWVKARTQAWLSFGMRLSALMARAAAGLQTRPPAGELPAESAEQSSSEPAARHQAVRNP